jgi:serine/threonine protein kinase
MGEDQNLYRPGREIYKDYAVVRYIDKGQYGQVYQVKNPDEVSFALKVFSKDVEMEQRAFALMKKQQSIRLVQVYEFGRTCKDEDCLLMAYHRQSFANLLARQGGPMSLHEADHWFEQLLKALIVLGRVGIIHRDIKPANLFVQDEILKIGDYGTTKFLVSDTLSHSTGAALTPFYAAPERFTPHYDMAVDRWAAAVIYFEMLSGRRPFPGRDVTEIYGAVQAAAPDYSPIPKERVSFLQTCFQKDPGDRHMDATQMLDGFKKIQTPHTAPRAPGERDRENCEQGMTDRLSLENDAVSVSEDDCKTIFELNDRKRPCRYIQNDYRVNGDGTVTDLATGLMWQQAGSKKGLSFDRANRYIDLLNRDRFAGFGDWRLPDIRELLSLLEQTRQNRNMYISPVFDSEQGWCWSANQKTQTPGAAWGVSFYDGLVGWYYNSTHVRGVRNL